MSISVAGQGTTFKILLPVDSQRAGDVQDRERKLAEVR